MGVEVPALAGQVLAQSAAAVVRAWSVAWGQFAVLVGCCRR